MPTWPVSLQQTMNASGFSYSRKSNLADPLNVEVGPPLTRVRYTGQINNISGSITCTASQVDDLLEFFDDDCDHGATPFTWVDPITGASTDMLFLVPPQVSALSGELFQAELLLQTTPVA